LGTGISMMTSRSTGNIPLMAAPCNDLSGFQRLLLPAPTLSTRGHDNVPEDLIQCSFGFKSDRLRHRLKGNVVV
jgi:hypothetical protein